MTRSKTLEKLSQKLNGRLDQLATAMGHDAVPVALSLDETVLALRRAGEGCYGVCTDCGKDIPLERLRIKPEAVRCVRCQTAYEDRFAHRPRVEVRYG